MITLVCGQPGTGKSYVGINFLMRDWLLNSQRHIYTNLPIEVRHDGIWEIVAQLVEGPAKRQAMQARCHLLEPGTQWVEPWTDPESGTVHPGAMRDRVREFWFFTRPNAVIILDEIADLYPADGNGAGCPDTLGQYCRMHRHLKDDAFFLIQHKADFAVKGRRMVQTVLVLENSTRENIFEWWALKGLKWPIQFFRVRQYQATSVMDLPTLENISGVSPQESWNVWPRAKGYKTYRSFSKVSFLGWKAPAESAASADVHQPWWWRVAGFLRKSPMLVGMVGAVIAAAFIGMHMFRALLDPTTATSILGSVAPSVGGQTNSGPVAPGAGSSVTIAPPKISDPVPAEVTPRQGETNLPAERVVLVTPGYLRTTRRDYAIGDTVGGVPAARFLLDGVLGSDGTVQRYSVVFPSE